MAALDIGTNTILMLVADVAADGTLVVIRDEHAVARLGQDVDRERRISAAALARADHILWDHLNLARSLEVDRIVAVGTSALRDASNREDLLAHWRGEFGLDVRVIDSDEEARLTYAGVFSGRRETSHPRAVIDIGGGSTEITLGMGDRSTDRFSVDLGAVRLTERFWTHYPPAPTQVDNARALIAQVLRQARPALPPADWHAVAGTPTTLASMALRLASFDAAAIDGYRLTKRSVSESLADILSMTRDQLAGHRQIHPQRADIIGAGALILDEAMEVYGISQVTVSVRGLRYGVAMEVASSNT